MTRTLTLVSMSILLLAACGEGGESAPPDVDAPTRGYTAPRGATPPATVVEPAMREFGDWRAVCDNGTRCVAYSGTDATSWIRIERAAGPTAGAPCVGFGLGFTGQEDTPDPVTLSADGKTVLRMQGRHGTYCADGLVVSPSDVLIGVADAQSLTLAGGGATGIVPAAGLKAALLWIDERQGRLGTTTALLRRGERPSSAVPPPPMLPRVIPAPSASQKGYEGAADPMNEEPRRLAVPAAIEALGEVRDCRADGNEVLNQAVLAARLDADTVLWGIPCGSGAYNATYVFYVTRPDGSNVRAADLPERVARTEGDVGGQDQWLVNPVYDAQRQTLTVFPRGRGLGDCGTITTWTWTARGFVLTEERSMGDCWGMSPDLWPSLWRSR